MRDGRTLSGLPGGDARRRRGLRRGCGRGRGLRRERGAVEIEVVLLQRQQLRPRMLNKRGVRSVNKIQQNTRFTYVLKYVYYLYVFKSLKYETPPCV